MSALAEFRFHQLTQVPAPRPADEEDPRANGAQPRPAPDPLAAALTGAHAELLRAGRGDGALLVAWVRLPGEPHVRFLVGGRPGFPPAALAPEPDKPDDPRPVLFPPGALAVDVAYPELAGWLGRFDAWVPCRGRSDPLWAPSPGGTDAATVTRGAFARYAAHLTTPYAWLVVAEPLRAEAAKPELDRLVADILPLARGEVSEAKRIDLERKRGRHRELSRAQLDGTWRIRVIVGGVDPAAAVTTAAMLSAATELDGLPYVLDAGDVPVVLGDALADPAAVVAGPELLVALTRPPDRELPGLRVVERHTFDLNQEVTVSGTAAQGPGLLLGDILDDAGSPAGEARLSYETLNRHTFVCGATGAGKSQTVRHLLAEATRAGLPWLVVEPAKAEYARMANRITGLGDVVVIRPGDPDTPPAGFNPLEPADGFPLQTHADRLKALFLAAFEPWEPFPQVLATAVVRCYQEQGWDLATGKPARRHAHPRYPTLGDLERVAAQVVADIGYGDRMAADVHGFIKVRLGSLRVGTTGRFFEGGHPLRFDRLHARNVVLEIEDIGDDIDKAFLMGAVLMRLAEHLWVENRERPGSGLRHLTVIEEAHRLLRRPEPGASGAAAKGVELFASLLAEVRAYGEGLIIAEQIPSKLTPDVIKNTAAKIVHRLPAIDDRESVGATMNLDRAQSRHVVSLTPGEGAVFGDGMDRPLLVKVPDGSDVERRRRPQPAPVVDLITRRSPSCGRDCAVEPCTLLQMTDAQQLLAEHRWLVVWAELTVLAHLAGHRTPDVAPHLLPGYAAARQSPRTFDCATSHAVDAALAARVAILQPTVDPDELAAHCCASIRAVADGADADTTCSTHGLRYLAQPYLWLEPRAALQDAAAGAPRHAQTEEWEARLGRHIAGSTAAEQRDQVEAWWGAVLDNRTLRDRVTFGTAQPSALERVLDVTRDNPGWPTTVAITLQPFRADWPRDHLIAEPTPTTEA